MIVEELPGFAKTNLFASGRIVSAQEDSYSCVFILLAVVVAVVVVVVAVAVAVVVVVVVAATAQQW